MTRDPGLASWLQLSLTPGLGAGAMRGMLRQFGLPQAVLERRRSELTAHAAPAVIAALDSQSVRDAVARALDWAAAPGHGVVTLADEHYRSEEHTSELQSRFDLVCRLLLEKKKNR